MLFETFHFPLCVESPAGQAVVLAASLQFLPLVAAYICTCGRDLVL